MARITRLGPGPEGPKGEKGEAGSGGGGLKLWAPIINPTGLMTNSAKPLVANHAWWVRMLPAFKTGTVKSLWAWGGGTVEGKVRGALFDLGTKTAEQYTNLWEGAEVVAGKEAWFELGKPELAITSGEELMAGVLISLGNQILGSAVIGGSLAAGANAQLPAGFLAVAGKVLPKEMATHTYAATSFGGAGAKLTEAEMVNVGSAFLLLGLIE